MPNTSGKHKGWIQTRRYGLLSAVYVGAEPGATALGANTAVDNVLVGTPAGAATPVDSVLFSNQVADGDFVWYTRNAAGANSIEGLRIDASAGLVVINEAAADIDFRIEGDNNANLLVIDGGTDSVASGAAVVAGAAFALSNLTGRTLVTAVGHQLHVPAGSLTDGGATGTITVLAPVFIGARTILATNTITYTDVAAIRAVIPIASTGATFTRTYGVWTNGQIRADSNFQVNNTAAFGTTEPTAAVVFQNGTAPAGAITTGGAIFTDGTNMRKIIAAGTVSNVET